MALTSQQKHYIKKNVDRYSPEKIAGDLGLPIKEIHRFIKKNWGEKKFSRLTNQNMTAFGRINPETKNLKDFAIQNINFLVVLLVLVGLAYYNSLFNAFVSDDIPTILKNPQIGDFHSALTSWMVGSGHNITDFLIYKVFGLNPVPFRLLNILFHLGSVWLVFFLVSTLINRRVAMITSAVFAVHPILIEAIGWISGAPYALFGFFALLSFFLYIRSENNKKLYYVSIASFILALMSSDKIIYFPGVLVLYELSAGRLWQNWKKYLPYFLIDVPIVLKTALAIGVRTSVLQTNFYQDSSGTQNLFVKIPTAISIYLKLIFWPQQLSLYQTELTFSILGFGLCLITALILISFAYYGWKKNRAVFFWLSFFVITLSPSLTPYKIAWIVAERYVYLGSIGIFIVCSMFLVWLWDKSGEEKKYYFYGFLAIMMFSLIVRTHYRNIDWKNEDNLWTATVKVSPSGAPIHNNMGDVYARAGNFQKAAEEFKRATEINPGYADAFHNLANTYQMAGQPDLAEKYYNKALSINPNIWQSYQNLAAIYFERGDQEKALINIQKALAINPTDQGLQGNLQIIQSGAPALPSGGSMPIP